MIKHKKNNYSNSFLITIVFVLLVTGCSKKITPPDTSDIPDSMKYVLEDALIGRKEARGNLGELYYEGELIPMNIKKALFWFELAGKDGDTLAQYNAGIIYKYELKDKEYPERYDKALYWFEKAAELGNVDAQIQVSQLYFNMFKQYDKALIWITRASKKNSVAMYNLAAMYSNKNTPIFNKKLAFKYLKESAEGGVTDGMYFLSKYYIKGEIPPKDNIIAYKWMKKSIYESKIGSDMGLLESRKTELKKLEKELTPEQIAAVNKELGYKN